jgi:hypothetical protein
LKREIGSRDEALRTLQGEFEKRSNWAFELKRDVAARDERLKRAHDELNGIHQAFFYRVLRRLGLVPK